MQQIQITPRYINPPKQAGWTNGSVKDTQGTLWSVDANALGMFQQNVPVTIGYEPAGGNKRYPQIVMVNGQPIGQQPVAGSFQQVGQAAPPMPQQPVQQPQYQQPAQAPAPPPPQPAHAPFGASKECGMFVMGILGRTLQGTGTFPDLRSLRDMVYNAKLAWEIEMEGKQEPAQPAAQPSAAPANPSNAQDGPPAGHPAGQEPPLNDSIPFGPVRDLP